ncbi:hypothetical protein E2C01_100755 [Portunus trituberculatus]|uniref:Uncharacterized protein n=1 Tax=Portunus trituberculatus TaxID=210409 RepID=A0A5B7KKC7_PORTR|nr:hypothetical protein [Portunus trituberculatus]
MTSAVRVLSGSHASRTTTAQSRVLQREDQLGLYTEELHCWLSSLVRPRFVSQIEIWWTEVKDGERKMPCKCRSHRWLR